MSDDTQLADDRQLTAEHVADGLLPQRPVISPDGRWVAYVVAPSAKKTARRLSEIWVAEADASTPPRRLTAGTAADTGPQWAPDSASLFFRSDRTGSVQLHQIRLDGGEAAARTDWRGEISAAWPLADGALVAVAASDEPTADDERRLADRDDVQVWGELVTSDRLRLLDLRTGALRVVSGLRDRHVVDLAQRPDGGPLAVLTWVSPEIDPGAVTNELHLVDPQTAAVTDLGQIERDAQSLTWWHADGGWQLAWLAQRLPLDGRSVFARHLPDADAATGTDTDPVAEHRNLTKVMTSCPTELVQVADGPPLALFADGLGTTIRRLDQATGPFEQLHASTGLVTSMTASDSGTVAALVSTRYEPWDVYAGPPGGPLTRLSDTRPELRTITWGTQERFPYLAADGLELEGLLILPVGKTPADGPFPLVTMVHGGPYGRHADKLALAWYPSGQWLAATGYAVFLPNPRGSEGRGSEFATAVTGDVGGAEWTDITAGIDQLIADGIADPGRLGILGWSHGGFLAAWAVGQTDRFKAAQVGAGICDWGMLVATGEAGTLEASLGGSCGWEGPGPHPHDQVSPISFAAKVSTPVQLVHGVADTNVPVNQAIYFHRALSQFGVPHQLAIYPREGHQFTERAHQLDLFRRTRAWFDRWLS